MGGEPQYHLIGHPASRSMRVLWALEELGLGYRLSPEQARSEAVLEVNPAGKIPVLLVDGAPLTDSVAILTYLADRHGGLTHPAGTLARARQDAVMQHLVAEMDAALWLLSKHGFVLPPEHRIDGIATTARYEFDRAMAQVERMKGDSPFVAGDRFTIADIVLSHVAGWALARRIPLPRGEMGAFLKSLRKRPAMARVMEIIEAQKDGTASSDPDRLDRFLSPDAVPDKSGRG